MQRCSYVGSLIKESLPHASLMYLQPFVEQVLIVVSDLWLNNENLVTAEQILKVNHFSIPFFTKCNLITSRFTISLIGWLFCLSYAPRLSHHFRIWYVAGLCLDLKDCLWWCLSWSHTGEVCDVCACEVIICDVQQQLEDIKHSARKLKISGRLHQRVKDIQYLPYKSVWCDCGWLLYSCELIGNN